MSTLPFMKLYPGDYLADTGHLTTTEHGAYLLLIMAYWNNGGPLKDDDRRLANQAKMSPEEWRGVRDIVSEFFTARDGHWHHKRIDAELGRAAEKSSKARDAAAKRWDSERNATGDADAMRTHMQSDMQTQCERISRRNASQKSDVRCQNTEIRNHNQNQNSDLLNPLAPLGEQRDKKETQPHQGEIVTTRASKSSAASPNKPPLEVRQRVYQTWQDATGRHTGADSWETGGINDKHICRRLAKFTEDDLCTAIQAQCQNSFWHDKTFGGLMKEANITAGLAKASKVASPFSDHNTQVARRVIEMFDRMEERG